MPRTVSPNSPPSPKLWVARHASPGTSVAA